MKRYREFFALTTVFGHVCNEHVQPGSVQVPSADLSVDRKQFNYEISSGTPAITNDK